MQTNVLTDTPGNIWKVMASVGDIVEAGQTLFIMELMKTEVPHTSPVAGKVSAINISEGQEGVDAGAVAVVIEHQ
ncbi:acetyl-CoA carboxylase biotin carboxyl carrier protein subunit [Mesorhizobium ventifaucium]|nr:acetyl-CoA carboxylase biotin carboxyl carrier protein subunit [Mesorhizobium ventifaucium]